MGALSGKGIVNTRAVHQADTLDSLLHAQGAIPLHYPAIAIVPPADTTALDAALFDLAAGRFEWLVLTSVNTVRMLAERLQALGLTLTGKACRAAAVGQATAEAAREQLGLEHLMVPPKYVAESLAGACLSRQERAYCCRNRRLLGLRLPNTCLHAAQTFTS